MIDRARDTVNAGIADAERTGEASGLEELHGGGNGLGSVHRATLRGHPTTRAPRGVGRLLELEIEIDCYAGEQATEVPFEAQGIAQM